MHHILCMLTERNIRSIARAGMHSYTHITKPAETTRKGAQVGSDGGIQLSQDAVDQVSRYIRVVQLEVYPSNSCSVTSFIFLSGVDSQ